MSVLNRPVEYLVDNGRWHVAEQAVDRLRGMYAEYIGLIDDVDSNSDDLRSAIVKRLMLRDPGALCQGRYLCAVDALMAEYEHAMALNRLDLGDWISRYVMALPADPLEALSYDRYILGIFSVLNAPH